MGPLLKRVYHTAAAPDAETKQLFSVPEQIEIAMVGLGYVETRQAVQDKTYFEAILYLSRT